MIICFANNTAKVFRGFFLSATLLLLTSPAAAMLNPASVYCRALGYEYATGMTEKGMVGVCKLPDGSIVNAGLFYKGKVALEWSYCVQQGYEAKRVENSEICKSCTACVLPSGEEVPVIQLMGLSFAESVCGDGNCGTAGEDYGTCPEDCPSGGADEYCDGIRDGICDPDCVAFEENDPDCNLLWQKAYNEMWGARKDENISLLRTFRDEFLVNSKVGREYTSMLYDNSSEVAGLLLQNPSLSAQANKVIVELLPGIESLATEGKTAIDRDTIEKIEFLLNQFEPKASPKLKTAIGKVKKDINKGEVFRKLGISVDE